MPARDVQYVGVACAHWRVRVRREAEIELFEAAPLLLCRERRGVREVDFMQGVMLQVRESL